LYTLTPVISWHGVISLRWIFGQLSILSVQFEVNFPSIHSSFFLYPILFVADLCENLGLRLRHDGHHSKAFGTSLHNLRITLVPDMISAWWPHLLRATPCCIFTHCDNTHFIMLSTTTPCDVTCTILRDLHGVLQRYPTLHWRSPQPPAYFYLVMTTHVLESVLHNGQFSFPVPRGSNNFLAKFVRLIFFRSFTFYNLQSFQWLEYFFPIFFSEKVEESW